MTDPQAHELARRIAGEYRERLERAADKLDKLAFKAVQRASQPGINAEHRRLRGKAEGVRLALSYFDEMVKAA